jgi:uncharacterized membrane protein YkvA (DUF1232 family)
VVVGTGVLSPGGWAAVGVGVLVVAALMLTLVVASRVLPPGRARELAGFLPNCVTLLRRLRRDTALPWSGRLVLGGALLYVMSPIQLIPNFIPVIGQSDDVAVVTVALRYACRRLPREHVVEAWPGDPAYLDRLLGTRPATPAGEVNPTNSAIFDTDSSKRTS